MLIIYIWNELKIRLIEQLDHVTYFQVSNLRGRSYLVKPGFTEGQHATATTVTALIVVIVNESKRRTGGHQTPTFAPVDQILERRGTMEHVAQLPPVCEFRHPTNLEVFAGLDRLRSLMHKLIKN